MFFFRDLGIDLGTANTLVYMKGKGIVMREPSVVAVRKEGNRREILAVGDEAKSMIGRTPGNIVAVRPLKEGVIADFEITEAMLAYFIRKALPRGMSFGMRTRVVICVPCGVTSVEKKAVEEAARNAAANYVTILEEPLASAIGAGLPVEEIAGSMIVDIGGGSSEVAVISYGGIVQSTSLRVAGNKFDEAITEYIKKECNLIIGDRTAEEIKMQIGSAFPTGNDLTMSVCGRDLLTGLPKTIMVSSGQVRDALQESLAKIIEGVKGTLEKTPPELAADIMERGIMLAGGGALLSGMDLLIRSETGIPVFIAEDPLDCVVLGAGRTLDKLDVIARSDRRMLRDSL